MKLIQGLVIALIAAYGFAASAVVQQDQTGRHVSVICVNKNYIVRVFAPSADYPAASMAVNDGNPGIMALVSNEIVRTKLLDNGIVYIGEKSALQVVGDKKGLKGLLKVGAALPGALETLVCEQQSQVMPIDHQY